MKEQLVDIILATKKKRKVEVIKKTITKSFLYNLEVRLA